MKNLEQKRAAAALTDAANLDRSAIAKLPALVMQNGLLATAAFCDADGGGDNRVDQKKAMQAIARHLQSFGIIDKGAEADLKSFTKNLCSQKPIDLQQATTEALAFLSYLKRFSKPPARS
jgi:CRISPR-associated protein Cmr5